MEKEQTIDEIFEQVGCKHKYQYFVVITAAIQWITQGLQLLSLPYIMITPQLFCDSKQCDQNEVNCKQFNLKFDPNFKHQNLITEFNLICERSYYQDLSPSLMFVSSIFGLLFFSNLGDIKGRRITFIISQFVTTLGVVIITVSQDIIQLSIGYCIIGFGINGVFNVSLVIINEICEMTYRQKFTIGLLMIYAIVEMLLPFFFYYINNWRTVYFILGVIPAIVGWILSFFVYETPQYYLSKNDKIKAGISLNQIARFNKRPQFDGSLIMNLPNQGTDKNKNYSYTDLFKYASLRNSTIGFLILIICLQIIYYGAQYGINQLANNKSVYYLGFSIGFAEFITYLFVYSGIEKLKRKKTLFISDLISIIACAAFSVFGIHFGSIWINCEGCIKCNHFSCNILEVFIIVVFSIIIRISNSICFSIQPLYANEVYPACIRSTGTGFVFAFGLMGGVLVPQIFRLTQSADINPQLVISFISTAGLFGLLMIKETHGQRLETEIVEQKQQSE